MAARSKKERVHSYPAVEYQQPGSVQTGGSYMDGLGDKMWETNSNSIRNW